jgi:hypothetical protein
MGQAGESQVRLARSSGAGSSQVLAAFHKNRPVIAGYTPVTFFCVALSQS